MVNSELEIQNLWHEFKPNKKNNWVLKDINFSLKPGELVGLLGPSGCGKTSLLRLIAGFDKPSRGLIKKNGEIISDHNFLLSPERRKIGMVFQDYALFPHLNVWDNVCFGINKNDQSIKRANWLLTLLDIYEFKSRYPHELSGGQCQRVALARALAPGTSLVLLDEPFCSLDVEVRSRLRSELSATQHLNHNFSSNYDVFRGPDVNNTQLHLFQAYGAIDDNHNTTSQITYTLQMICPSSSYPDVYFNYDARSNSYMKFTEVTQ